MTETLWRPIEKEGEDLINEVLHINQQRSLVLAVYHPAVLLWRHYAMTLDRGRYAQNPRPAARLVLRLLWRLVHGNRRIRALFVDRNGTPRPWHPNRIFMRPEQAQQSRSGKAPIEAGARKSG
jgi:hypothetical protein